MESGKKRIRLEFAPLNVAVSMVCATPNSPVVQVVNTILNQYEPDRTLTPTVLLPQVVASASDGSWPEPHSNSFLAEMQWLSDGVDITTVKEWENKYSIGTVGSTRGSLTIKRNLSPNERISLVFKAVLVDKRTGINYPIETDPIVLSSSVKSQDQYTVGIGDSQIIQYDVFKDKLAIYDYKVAQGIISASSSAQSAATDENAYIRKIPVTVFRGEKPITSGFTLKYSRVNADLSLTSLLTTDDEVISFDNTQITLDLRLLTKADYLIKVVADNHDVAQIQFSVNRVYPAFSIRPTNGISISPTDLERTDVAMVDCDGNIIDYPEVMLRMVWKTDSSTLKEKVHNEGQRTVFLLSSTGIGDSYTNDWLDVYVEADHKEAHSIATDDNGDVFTDETGTELIFN
jgi:hypothetical protein